MAGNKKSFWGRVGLLAVFALSLTFLIWFLADEFPGVLSDQDHQISLTHSLLLLSFFLASAVLHGRFNDGKIIRNISIWSLVAIVLFVGYSYRGDMSHVRDRLLGELMPQRARTSGENVVLFANRSGHFAVDANVDGVTIHFLIDTGASDVVLSPNDASLLGFDLDKLTFSKTYQTANGIVRGAPVKLGRISISHLNITEVRASVNGAAMNSSLLGMSFLSRLSGYEVRGNQLILRP